VILYFARRYLGYGAEEWRGLPWHVRRAYLEGMEADETVPLTFERPEDEDGAPEVIPGMQVRGAAPAAPDVIDITGMLADLEASRRTGW